MSTDNTPSTTYRVVQTLYDQLVRDRLPRKLGLLNGVVVRRPRLLDATDRDPEYKSGLLDPLREHARRGETVINIGGGSGVSTVVAARQVGESGRVICYEGGEKYVALCREATRLNDVTEQVEVEHAIVGDDVNVWGVPGDVVSPGALPSCDCLVMDCEGAEWSILTGLDQRPRVLVVEVHPQHGVVVEDVRELLEDWGYEVSVGENGGVGYHGLEGNPVVTGVRPCEE